MCEEKRREVGKRSPVWLLRLHDFMHALEHNFEQLHIFQETVISTVSNGKLIIKLFSKSLATKSHPFFGSHNPTTPFLSSLTLVIAQPYHEHSRAMEQHRSHSNLVREGFLDTTCQCLLNETFLVKKPRRSSRPAQPAFGGPFCLSRNIHQISDCLQMFYSSASHQGSPSACDRKPPLLSRRGRDKSKAVAKCLIKCCPGQWLAMMACANV